MQEDVCLLAYRCKQLEKALAEANSRVQELEVTNSTLEKKLVQTHSLVNLTNKTK